MKIEECLAVNDNPVIENEDEAEITLRRPNTTISKRIPTTRGKSKSKQPTQKGRGRRQKLQQSIDSSDSEEENNPGRRRRKERIIESDSEDEQLRRKHPQSNRKLAPTRSTRSNRSKIIEEMSSSGENVLRENNSFDN